MRPPTAQEINPTPKNFDEQRAVENFLGKSLEEAEAMFRENAFAVVDDLMWMGPVAFRFYVPAAIHFSQSEAAKGEGDFINGFISVLKHRLEFEADELRPVAEQLASGCDYLIQHHNRFNLMPEIDGDVPARLAALHEAFTQLAQSKAIS